MSDAELDAVAVRCGLRVTATGYVGRRDSWMNFALELHAILRDKVNPMIPLGSPLTAEPGPKVGLVDVLRISATEGT